MVDYFLVVNYKAYPQAFSRKGIELAEHAHRLDKRLSKTRVILAVPAPMVYRIAGIHEDVYLQHVDPIGYGSHTGFLPAEAVKELPVRGTLVNHSEHKLVYRDTARVVEAVKESGKEVLACADTPGEAAGLAYLEPTMIAVEPPELIGTGIPVSKAKPEVITASIKAVHGVNPGIPVLAGAGITSSEDVEAAVRLGARGVLVASAIMKANKPW